MSRYKLIILEIFISFLQWAFGLGRFLGRVAALFLFFGSGRFFQNFGARAIFCRLAWSVFCWFPNRSLFDFLLLSLFAMPLCFMIILYIISAFLSTVFDIFFYVFNLWCCKCNFVYSVLGFHSLFMIFSLYFLIFL